MLRCRDVPSVVRMLGACILMASALGCGESSARSDQQPSDRVRSRTIAASEATRADLGVDHWEIREGRIDGDADYAVVDAAEMVSSERRSPCDGPRRVKPNKST
jgi:hypothetical protein